MGRGNRLHMGTEEREPGEAPERGEWGENREGGKEGRITACWSILFILLYSSLQKECLFTYP